MQGDQTGLEVMASLSSIPRPWLIGVIHLPALPGAPGATLAVEAVARNAVEDARILEESGFNAVMLENYNDAPFPPGAAQPETIASMALVARRLCEALNIPVGVQVLRNDALGALGVAAASEANFLRVNVLSGASATDQGIIQGQADVLLRKRAALGLERSVEILADVDVKHATSLDTRPVEARALDLARRGGADAVLVTGHATGSAVDLEQLRSVARAVAPTPTLAASGTTPETLADILEACDGAVIGSALKDPITHRIDRSRAAAFGIPRAS